MQGVQIKRARMGRTPDKPKETTPQRRRKPSTRARTLKDMINTIGEKDTAQKLESPVKTREDLGTWPATSTEPTVTALPPDEDSESSSSSAVIASKRSVRSVSETGPTARWGHTLSMISEDEAILVGGQGGQGDKQQMCRDAVWHLDLVQGRWKSLATSASGNKPDHRMGHAAVYDPMVRSIYLFGGSKKQKWFNDVHILDVDEWKWQLIKADGKAPTRAYHSCTLYRHELWIFGGIYPRPMSQPDGCSNDIYVFSPIEEGWYTPIVMGDKPKPKSGHSATLLQDKLVVFGGWDAPVCFNDLHILDLGIVEWSQPVVNGTPPSPRSWHASCALSGNRVLIHGGYNGNNALDDSFIFNLDTSTWTNVKLEPPLAARAGHTALCLPYRYENEEKDEVLIFGGGDNEGSFFQDLVGVMIPFKPPVPSIASST